ncbi:MAG: hypothetical protein E7302_14220 [Butyrivibrio sp.]|nr:hypothetical protein [Butyrivibrio sp.]
MKYKRFYLESAVVMMTAIAMIAALYVLLGYHGSGIRTPFRYGGGDAYTNYATIKNLGENGKYWENDYLGAPFSSNEYDFSASFLQNTERLSAFIIYKFAGDVFTTANIQYMLTFPFCMIIAYIVLRNLGIKMILALLGAVTYGFAPAAFSRGIHHYCLAACYFIPLAILLCVWLYEDERFFALDKGFFKYKRNWAGIVIALLIANNGIAYYPFFTCFYIAVIIICGLLRGKKPAIIIRGIVSIAFIAGFMVLALLPTVIYHHRFGATGITARSVADAEQYSLKITQMFIPTFDHGIGRLGRIIATYNTNMPLVNENGCAYLGLAAGVGFILSMFYLFVQRKENEVAERNTLMGLMNLSAILFFTVGGVISLISVVIENYSLRGYNRVSVFIMFAGIVVLCSSIQMLLETIKIKPLRIVILGVTLIMFAVSIWIQTPPRGYYYDSMQGNKAAAKSDKEFIEYIEDEAGEGAMIFQLPYHKYPEGGPVIGMPDYAQLTGFLFSNNLRWSYGGVFGRYSDEWNRTVSELSAEDMVEVIARAGFSGICIDQRAYDEETLNVLDAELSSILGATKYVSENGSLSYYTLTPYTNSADGIGDKKILSIEEIAAEYSE